MSAINSTNPYNNFLQIKNLQSKPVQYPANTQSLLPAANKPIAAANLTPEEEKSNNFTKAVAGVAIFGGIVGIVLGKAGSGSFYKKLSSYLQKLNNKIYDYSQKYKTLSSMQKVGLKITQGFQKALSWVNISNNITAFKDIGFRRLCEKLHLSKPMNWITKQFQKITIRSSAKAHEKARNVMDNKIHELREIITQLPEGAEKNEIKKLLTSTENIMQQFTSTTRRKTRLNQTIADTKDVGDKVLAESAEFFKNRNKRTLEKLRLYRTEVHSAEGKERLSHLLEAHLRTFTFNVDDKTKIMSAARDEIGKIIKAEDTASRKILRELSTMISQYKACSGAIEDTARAKVVENMQSAIRTLTNSMTRQGYSKETMTMMESKLNEFHSIFKNTNERGSFERILSLLNQSIKQDSPGTYSKAKSIVNDMRKVLKKASDSELKMYDKFAEYSVGSAPTDFLGMLLPVGLAGYAISKGENKEEKTSATLKAGIPIVGGVVTTFIAAAKMMTNIQGLAMGAIVSLGLNAAGSKADEKYKQGVENSLFAQKAIEAYKKANHG